MYMHINCVNVNQIITVHFPPFDVTKELKLNYAQDFVLKYIIYIIYAVYKYDVV